jgi:hypothetical protein
LAIVRIEDKKSKLDSSSDSDLDNNNNNVAHSDVEAPKEILEQYKKRKRGDSEDLVNRKKWIDQECPICFEKMTEAEPTTWCRYVCGNSFHTSCFDQWLKNSGKTCVLCRSEIDKKSKRTHQIVANGLEYVKLDVGVDSDNERNYGYEEYH